MSRMPPTIPHPEISNATLPSSAAETPFLPNDLIRQHPHRQCVKIGTIIVQYRTIVTGEQISGLSGAVGFEQGRLDFAVGPAPVQRLNPQIGRASCRERVWQYV